ncbi:MAG TPA: sigma-70 family RNA polymerase sigma factor [Acidimicrobiales bacterium]|nr:sigma-70 family RNA polymerase sigma factor [Acidimicrobiales bacterium]
MIPVRSARVTSTDAELVAAAADGQQSAFAELYRRHRDKAGRAAQVVASNTEDSADAVSDAFAAVFRIVRAGRFPAGADFGAYLLTATRRNAIDQVRRAARTTLHPHLDRGESADMRPSGRVVAVESAAMMAQAFGGLSANLRTVLYFTEVLEMPLREVAAVLGITPNACAQRAVRARARLRQRYLQAHVAPSADRACRATVANLGAYVGGGLADGAREKADAHLAACETCRHRVVELRHIGSVLRKAVPREVDGTAGAPATR